MKKVLNQIKNYIQLHTSEMENEEYIELMKEISVWSNNEADLISYRKENESGINY